MGQTSQEFISDALSANYSAYFKTFQFRNWCPVQICVTEPSGQQHFLPACERMRDCEAHVEIECLQHNGMRVEYTEFGMKPIPMKGIRTTITYDCIRNHPYKVLDYNLIISTIDQATIALQMLNEINYSPVLYETRADDALTDPRLVFQVIDPGNRWDELYVNVFGQTIRIRAGHWSNVLPIASNDQTDARLCGQLICYLRYPEEYCNTERTTSTLFQISLESIDQEEPMQLPDGQSICVASSLEALRRVTAKLAAGQRGIQVSNLANAKMVPKDLYDSAMENFKQQLDRVKMEEKVRYDSMVALKNSEIANLRAERDAEKAKSVSLQAQLERWEGLNRANTAFLEGRAKAELADTKVRDAAVESARKDVEHAWNLIKIGGGFMVTLASFALTMALKKK